MAMAFPSQWSPRQFCLCKNCLFNKLFSNKCWNWLFLKMLSIYSKQMACSLGHRQCWQSLWENNLFHVHWSDCIALVNWNIKNVWGSVAEGYPKIYLVSKSLPKEPLTPRSMQAALVRLLPQLQGGHAVWKWRLGAWWYNAVPLQSLTWTLTRQFPWNFARPKLRLKMFLNAIISWCKLTYLTWIAFLFPFPLKQGFKYKYQWLQIDYLPYFID